MNISKSDYNAILKQYDITHAKNILLQKERIKKVIKKIPEIQTLNESISNIAQTSIMEVFKNPSQKELIENNLKSNINLLHEKKANLLETHGYSRNYLEPIYTCLDCKDTAFINNKRCHCLEQKLINFSYKQSNISDVLTYENFNTFSFEYYSDEVDPSLGISPLDNMKSIHYYCLDFVKTFDNSFKNLVLYGATGLGKTFMCNCIAKELLDQGKTIIYLTAFQLFSLFENYKFHKNEEIVSYDELENIYNCDLLIIDDLGSELVTALTGTELFNCLNLRLLKNNSTVISTNLSTSELNITYSERITSRIFGNYTQLKFIGNDIRLRQRF